MPKAVININGLIGSWEGEKGVELTDIVAQMRMQPNPDSIEVRIGNSIGGLVDVGFAICDYLKSFRKPITTVVYNYCASITSAIFMIGNRRVMMPGSALMIHNPWGKPEGSASELELYAAELRQVEKQFVNIYDEKTQIGQEALALLMKHETEMGADDAVRLGFATEIGQSEKIAAYINQNRMSTQKKSLKEQLDAIQAKLRGARMFALTLQDGTGKEIVFDTENDAPAIGDKATVDGQPANGEYVMPDGRTFVFANGILKKIKEADKEKADPSTTTKVSNLEEAVTALADTMDMVLDLVSKQNNEFKAFARSVKSNYYPSKQGSENRLLGFGSGRPESVFERIQRQRNDAEAKKGGK